MVIFNDLKQKYHIIYNDIRYIIPYANYVDHMLNNDTLLLIISNEDLLAILRDQTFVLPLLMAKKIELYDSSEAVNSFIYNGKNYWFSKEVRTSLLNIANHTEESVELALGDEIITINSELLKLFLADLEVYAQKCFINTKKHTNNIKLINKLEDLINYDYTIGYPEKIELNVDTTI